MALKAAELYGDLVINDSKWNSSMARAHASLASIGTMLRNVGATMSIAVTGPIVMVGKSMLDFAMDAVESENLFEVSMGKMSEQARKWSEDLGKALGLNRYAIRANLATFNVMLNSMGLGTEKSYEMAAGMTKLAYDMASFYNLSPEAAFEKLRSGIAGEIEPLRALGVSVTEAMIQAYAYKHGIAQQGDQLTESQKIIARYGVIMAGTAKAHGDLARTADSPTNRLRRLKESARELGIQMGQFLIPIFDRIVAGLSRLQSWLDGLSPGMKRAVASAALLAAALGPALAAVGQILLTVATIVPLFAEGGALAGAGSAIVAALSGPVGWIIGALALIVAGVVLLWKRSEAFRAAIKNAWETIKNAVAKLGAALRELWQALQPVFMLWGAWLAILGKAALFVIVNTIGFIAKEIKLVADALSWVIRQVAAFFSTYAKRLADCLVKIGWIVPKAKELAKELREAIQPDKIVPKAKVDLVAILAPGLRLMEQMQKVARQNGKAVAEAAREAAEAEIDEIVKVIEKQREATAEKRNQMREMIGFTGVVDLWNMAMEASVRSSVGKADQSGELRTKDIPQTKELQAIRAQLKEQQTTQIEVRNLIRERLGVVS